MLDEEFDFEFVVCFRTKGEIWLRYIRSFPIVAEIRTLAYRFDRPGSIREERNLWCVLVLPEPFKV